MWIRYKVDITNSHRMKCEVLLQGKQGCDVNIFIALLSICRKYEPGLRSNISFMSRSLVLIINTFSPSTAKIYFKIKTSCRQTRPTLHFTSCRVFCSIFPLILLLCTEYFSSLFFASISITQRYDWLEELAGDFFLLGDKRRLIIQLERWPELTSLQYSDLQKEK